MVYLLYILPHWSVRHTSSIDTASNNLWQWLAVVLTFVSACMTGLTALDEKPAVPPSTTANMTTPNQLMELSHPQSHDDASTPNASLMMTVKLAALSRGVVPAGTDECSRWALTNFAAWMHFNSKPRVKASRRPNDHATLNTHIIFLVRARNARESRIDFYPLKTLHQLLCVLSQTFY